MLSAWVGADNCWLLRRKTVYIATLDSGFRRNDVGVAGMTVGVAAMTVGVAEMGGTHWTAGTSEWAVSNSGRMVWGRWYSMGVAGRANSRAHWPRLEWH